MTIAPATDSDSRDVIELIDEVYREYGEVMYLEGADADLAAIEETYRARGGEFWVCRAGDGELAGTMAVKIDDDTREAALKRMYVRKAFRGKGLAGRLFDTAVAWALARRATRLVSWSDTRFERAHAFYAKRGMTRIGVRHMTDGAMPYSEYGFAMDLTRCKCLPQSPCPEDGRTPPACRRRSGG